MRRALAPLGVFVLLASSQPSCGSDSNPSPLKAGTPPRTRLPTRPPITLGVGEARVQIDLDVFALHVKNARDEVVLDTLLDEKTAALSDPDATHAYGALGATHRETLFNSAIIEGWDHTSATDSPWHHALAVEAVTEATSLHASLVLFDPTDDKPSYLVEIGIEGAAVRIDAHVEGAHAGPDEPINEMGISFALPDDEHFFGLGERFGTVDHRGQHYECWTEEGGVGGGEGHEPGHDNPGPNGIGMTHVPIPFYISSKGYGLWQETSYRTGFVFGASGAKASRIYAEEPALHLRVLVHDDPKQTLGHFTALTGRAHLPAPWVFGPRRRVDHGAILPKDEGTEEDLSLRRHHVPTTGLDDATHFLPTNSSAERQAFLADWTDRVHKAGFKAIGYFNTYVSLTDPKAKPLVDYGRMHDLFVQLDPKATEGGVGGEFDTFMVSAGGQTVATIDLTKPDAVEWFQSLQGQALALGYDGWMLDFGEYLPQQAKMYDGRTGWEMHNAFPVVYQHASYDYLRKVRGDDFMFFARSGYTGTQATVPIVWSGDPTSSFDEARGLPANVRAGINAGISGIPFWGSDISGYTCFVDVADKEVYLRWAEFGALSSDMHDENACAQKAASAPAKWTLWSDAETTDVYARYALLHTRLNPYIVATGKEAEELGLPVIRHPMLMHPKEPGALASTVDYWFGPSLYVTPVVHRGDRTRKAWLPPGTWFDFWTGAAIKGGVEVTGDAPLDVIPIYLRSGGIVAMLDPSVETLAHDESDAVVSAEDVAGILDVRAAIDLSADESGTAGTGTARLVDGTNFYVQLKSGAVALPAGFTLAPDEATLATCTNCGRIDDLPGGVKRVRLTTGKVTSTTLNAGQLLLRAERAPTTTRFRWDVAVLPG